MRPTPAASARLQLLGRLVVAVQHDALGREPRVQGDVQLAAGRDVEVEALFGHEPRHRGAEKRLARVRDAVTEARAVLAAPNPELVFVVYVERCTELDREPDQIDAADRQTAVGLDPRRPRQQRQVERAGSSALGVARVVLVFVEAGHLVGRGHTEQSQRVRETDPGRLREPQAAPASAPRRR